MMKTMINGKENAMFKEKSGFEVLIVGKRVIVYDANANKVEQMRLFNYTWPVKAK